MTDGGVYSDELRQVKARARKLAKDRAKRCSECGGNGYVAFENDRFGSGFSTRRCVCNPYPEDDV